MRVYVSPTWLNWMVLVPRNGTGTAEWYWCHGMVLVRCTSHSGMRVCVYLFMAVMAELSVIDRQLNREITPTGPMGLSDGLQTFQQHFERILCRRAWRLWPWYCHAQCYNDYWVESQGAKVAVES